MPNEVLVKYPDGTFKTHLLYRTHEHKEFKEMQNPEKYREQQKTSSIDTLNNALKNIEPRRMGSDEFVDPFNGMF